MSQVRSGWSAVVVCLVACAGCVKGEKGDLGPQGDPGPQGERGAQGPSPTPADIQQAVSAMPNLDVPSLGGRPASGYVDTLTGGRVYEAEKPPLNAAATVGSVADDATASGGKARQALFGSASGSLYAVASSDITEPLSSGPATVEFRLKVLTNASATNVATAGCSAIRAGGSDFAVLAQRSVAPSQFPAANGWQSYRLDCDFAPDDVNQMVWVDYVTGITDFSIDRVRVSPLVRGFQGFSVYATGTAKAVAWGQATFNAVKFNTFGNAYDSATSRFTAPFGGYYRFSMGGYSPTATSGVDSRVAVALVTNGVFDSVSGGQQSSPDSPMPCHIQVVHLDPGDTVSVYVFSTMALTLGSSTAGHGFWLQGEYLGR